MDKIIYTGRELLKLWNASTFEEAKNNAAMAGKRLVRFIPGQQKREGKKVGRNEKCPCGSGLKFKKCCLNARREERVNGQLRKSAIIVPDIKQTMKYGFRNV